MHLSGGNECVEENVSEHLTMTIVRYLVPLDTSSLVVV